MIGSHVAVQTRTETALRLYLGRAKGKPDRWLLIDMTPGLDPKQNELEYDGDSVADVLDELESDNHYPKGAISIRIDANPIGAPALMRRFDTDGKTALNTLSSRAGLLSIILGRGAVIAAPFTGGGSLLVTALIIGSATAGVLSLADHLSTGEVSATAIALDILTIATSFLNAGLAVKVMRGSPGVVLASRGVRYLLWTNFTLEGVSAILVGVEGAEQIISSARSCRVQRARPAGGLEQATAISRASSFTSSFRAAPARGDSLKARSSPSSTKRCLVRYTVDVPTATFRAISSSVDPASAANKICARLSLRTAALPPRTIETS